MNKQLKLNDAARRLVRMLGNELTQLGAEQNVAIWMGRFELSVVEADKIWFSFHPSYYYLDDPNMGKVDESTVQQPEELSAKAS